MRLSFTLRTFLVAIVVACGISSCKEKTPPPSSKIVGVYAGTSRSVTTNFITGVADTTYGVDTIEVLAIGETDVKMFVRSSPSSWALEKPYSSDNSYKYDLMHYYYGYFFQPDRDSVIFYFSDAGSSMSGLLDVYGRKL